MKHQREYTRKAIHITFGLLILALIYFAGVTNATIVLGSLLILGSIISFAISGGYKIPILKEIVEGVERDNEKSFPGKAAVYFFISAILLLVLFKDHQQIILAAISVQVFADSAAAIVGINIGKHKIYNKKSWEGSIACFLIAAICINIFFPAMHIVIIGAIVATIVELLPLDDNLFVPLFTAVALRILI
jgi:dolichol kinase